MAAHQQAAALRHGCTGSMSPYDAPASSSAGQACSRPELCTDAGMNHPSSMYFIMLLGV
jgi:hypothetical protein